ncbi:transposase [Sandaracinus amylolyticus]|uniref:transposase n=1 Tax=Sandaracinus amylolyticus TaxID=927083 RepID=UPI001AF589B6|nr:transposase [Sandaracinus amylolyticus]QRN75841.1 Transposase [Sandaracinus sp.]UJR87381.1 IS91 family transposase [Sandaracinus amylolyticus]
MLHRIVREHLETFLARRAEADAPMPGFVVDELRGYLECGVLARGAVRFACSACGHDRLVGLSCKGRGFCPRCLGRRMTETARHWVRSVLPRVRIRQWVLSLPFALRVSLAYHHDLTLAVLSVAARAIEGFYRERARDLGIECGRTGSITVVQRFGSDLALNVHFHILALDGVYDARGSFTALAAPTRDELHVLTSRIAERITRLCERRALDADLDDSERVLCAAFARSAARRGAIAHAPDHDFAPDHALRRKARIDGFDLDATTEVRAEDRERLEHLCRYLLRPPLADRRLRLLPAEQVALELKTPWRDGTRWLTMSADTFLERLCSLVPRPNTHQVIHRGVLASHAAWRPRVIPRPDDGLGPRPKNATFCALMKHGLDLDVLACPCGARMKYVTTIFDRRGLQRLLRAKDLPHLG